MKILYKYLIISRKKLLETIVLKKTKILLYFDSDFIHHSHGNI